MVEILDRLRLIEWTTEFPVGLLRPLQRMSTRGDSHWPERGSSAKRHVASDCHPGCLFS